MVADKPRLSPNKIRLIVLKRWHALSSQEKAEWDVFVDVDHHQNIGIKEEIQEVLEDPLADHQDLVDVKMEKNS